MSDGEDSYPQIEIDEIKANYLNDIYKFCTVGYGDEDFSVLKQMLISLYGNDANFKNPSEPLELLNLYVEIARDDNLIIKE